MILAVIIIVFRFNFDYKRTENVQFEDDEYYYFVKAIPKTRIPVTEKRVENISAGEDRNLRPQDTEDINTGGVFRNRDVNTPPGEA